MTFKKAFRAAHAGVRVERKRAKGPQDGPPSNSSEAVPYKVTYERGCKADCQQARNGKSVLGAHRRGKKHHKETRDGQAEVFGKHRREH